MQMPEESQNFMRQQNKICKTIANLHKLKKLMQSILSTVTSCGISLLLTANYIHPLMSIFSYLHSSSFEALTSEGNDSISPHHSTYWTPQMISDDQIQKITAV